MKIGNAIRAVREYRQLKQQELYRISNVTETSLSLIECNHRIPNKSNLQLIADALNVSVGSLFILAVEPADFTTLEEYEAAQPLVQHFADIVFPQMDASAIHAPRKNRRVHNTVSL
jgi:transcriptional regulator with XRE-family HTH domain